MEIVDCKRLDTTQDEVDKLQLAASFILANVLMLVEKKSRLDAVNHIFATVKSNCLTRMEFLESVETL